MMMNLGRPDLAWRRRRRWQQDYAQVRGDVRGYGALPESVAAVVAESSGRTVKEAIFVSVTAGVLVWSITKILDKLFGGGR